MKMRVAITIPVFNEMAQLAQSLERLRAEANKWSAFDSTFIIADNGSTDGTTEIARRLAAEHGDIRCEELREKGRGRALRQAWQNADADIVSYMDVDLSTELTHFPQLVAPLLAGKADIAVGSRLLKPEWTRRGWKREILSRGYNGILKAVFSQKFSDAQCGFKAMTKECAKRLLPLIEDNEWFFDTELLILAESLGYRIFDLPVRWADDPDSRVRIIRTIIADLKGVLRLRRTLGLIMRDHEHGVGERNGGGNTEDGEFRRQHGLPASVNQQQ